MTSIDGSGTAERSGAGVDGRKKMATRSSKAKHRLESLKIGAFGVFETISAPRGKP